MSSRSSSSRSTRSSRGTTRTSFTERSTASSPTRASDCAWWSATRSPCAASRARSSTTGGRVSDRLWLDRALVGEYVERNPYEVPEEQLDVAAPWRYALRDVFIIVRAAEDHILAMNRDALFCVERLEAPADRHVRAVPSLTLLTLLPFKGAIVTDSKFIHLEDEMDPSLIGNIRESAHEFAHSGVVSGADALVRYSRELPDANRVPESWQRQLDEVLGLPHVPGITA